MEVNPPESAAHERNVQGKRHDNRRNVEALAKMVAGGQNSGKQCIKWNKKPVLSVPLEP